jgi:hypothetical protein
MKGDPSGQHQVEEEGDLEIEILNDSILRLSRWFVYRKCDGLVFLLQAILL